MVIIGAGPAGLAAGYRLCGYKINTIILEQRSGVGGLSRSLEYKGYYFDIGPHRFFTKNKLVFRWWNGILKADFIKKPRYTRIYYNGKFFSYPILIRNVISNLGIFVSLLIGYSYLKSRLFPSQNEDNFQNWVTNRFGKRLFQIFFKDYTEKIWGMPCNQISADWAAQRIKGLSLSSAVRNALFKDKKNTVKSLIKKFHYPRLGAGMMYEAVAQRIIQQGGPIKLNSEIIEIKHNNAKITGLICRDSNDGSLFEIEGSHFLSSMPISLLVSRMSPAPDESILKICKSLNYRSLLIVYLILGRKDLFKDNWIYIHSRDVLVGRIQNYKNWSPDMINDPDKSSLGLEYFCTEGDSTWSQLDEKAIELAAKESEKLKLIQKADILDAFVLRVPNAYPVYDINYGRAVAAIRDFVSRFLNLQCIGRAGMFRYNNMDHSILTGFLAADNIQGAKNDIWNVNVEQSYHEELEESGVTPFG